MHVFVRIYSESTEFICEPDEYALLVKDLKQSGLIKDHRSGLRTYKNSFIGKDFVKWVMQTKGLGMFAIYFLLNLI